MAAGRVDRDRLETPARGGRRAEIAARARHTFGSIWLSVGAGVLFAFLASMGDSGGEIMFLAVLLGAFVGFALSPAAVYARADRVCRVSFLWVLMPVSAIIVCISVPGVVMQWDKTSVVMVSFFVSVPAYILACVVIGLLAIPRRRRLRWYGTGHCSHCGYDVRGLDETRCPECGKIARQRPPMRVPAAVLRAEP